MIKATAFFRNIEDIDAFQEFYLKEVFPVLNSLAGLTHITVTSVFPMNEEDRQSSEGIRLIIETHYESEEAMYAGFASQEARDVMELIGRKAHGELYLYLAQEKRVDLTNTRITTNTNTSRSRSFFRRLIGRKN